MSTQPTTTRTPIADDLTQDEIQGLIADRKGEGATSCEVVTENGKRFLITKYPPPKVGD